MINNLLFSISFFLQTFQYGCKRKNYKKLLFFLLGNLFSTRFKLRKSKILGDIFTFSDMYSFVWQYYEIFVLGYYDFISTEKYPTVIDLGSNVGVAVKRFKYLYPQSTVISFEPNLEAFNLLKVNLRNEEKIEFNNSAIWVTNTKLRFNSKLESDSSSITRDNNGHEVDAVALNDILLKYEKIDFLKMDIEGPEVMVIESAIKNLSRINNIFIEFHYNYDFKNKLGVLLKALEDSGFLVYLRNNDLKFINPYHRILKDDYSFQVNLFGTRINE